MASSLHPLRAEIFASGLFPAQRAPLLAGDRARALALLAGCAVGLGLSWYAVLSDGARDRLAAAIAELSVRSNAVVPSDTRWPDHDDPFIPGMKPDAGRQPESELPVGPQGALALPVENMDLPPEPVAQATVAPLSTPTVQAAAMPPPSEAGVPTQAMEVIFQLNSSYLPAGAADELGRFLDRLPQQGPVELEAHATVSDDGVKDADSTAAQRYNRWLAERRLARVEEFLERHGHGRIKVSSSLLEHDSSRRVLLRERSDP